MKTLENRVKSGRVDELRHVENYAMNAKLKYSTAKCGHVLNKLYKYICHDDTF